VAKVLHRNLPPLAILTAEQQLGSPEAYQQHVLHVEPHGAFSVLVLVWRPGQFTSIHDHVCWGAVGVVAGVEHEVRYALHRRGGHLQLVERDQSDSFPGQVTGFAPPGDIHQVRNNGADVAVSLHIYGADIGARGSSVRRTYPASLRRTPGGGPHRVISGRSAAYR